MAGSYETEDGEPKYGRRLSQEELDAYRREHRLPAPDSSSSGRRPTRTVSGVVGTEADPTAGPGLQGRVAPVGTGEFTAAGSTWGHAEQTPLRRWRLLVAGLIVMLLVPFAMTVGALLYVVEGPLSAGAALGETGTVYLEQGSNWALYSPSLAGSILECSPCSAAAAAMTRRRGFARTSPRRAGSAGSSAWRRWTPRTPMRSAWPLRARKAGRWSLRTTRRRAGGTTDRKSVV